ncbi:MAG: pyruvate dehydrogenase (acetyl-transferring) E1 component subunit alpha, partial [Geminicoccaceae bacterium]
MATAQQQAERLAPVGKRAGESDALPATEELLTYYREMLLIRRFEEKAGQLYGMGLIGGFCHLY